MFVLFFNFIFASNDPSSQTLKVFISYNNNPSNLKYIEEFITHASSLKRSGLLSFDFVASQNLSNENKSINSTFGNCNKLLEQPTQEQLREYDWIIICLSPEYANDNPPELKSILNIISLPNNDPTLKKPIIFQLKLIQVFLLENDPLNLKTASLPISTGDMKSKFLSDYTDRNPIFTEIMQILRKTYEETIKTKLPNNDLSPKNVYSKFTESPLQNDDPNTPDSILAKLKNNPHLNKLFQSPAYSKSPFFWSDAANIYQKIKKLNTIHFLYASNSPSLKMFSSIKANLVNTSVWSSDDIRAGGSTDIEMTVRYSYANTIVFLLDANFLGDNKIDKFVKIALNSPEKPTIIFIVVGFCSFEDYLELFEKCTHYENIKIHNFTGRNAPPSFEEKVYKIAQQIKEDMK